MESNNEAVRRDHFHSTVLVAAGYDPYQLVEQAVAAAAQISGSSLLFMARRGGGATRTKLIVSFWDVR